MTTLDLLRSSHEGTYLFLRPRRSNHFPLICDRLEPRQLLSAVPVTPSSTSNVPAAISVTPGATAGGSTLGSLNSGGTVETTGIGSIQFIQSALPVTGLVDNLNNVPTTVSASPGPISVASGLVSLSISPLLPSTVSSNETPLNNGTPIPGTVWITPIPEAPSVFHPTTTASPTTESTSLQPPNPQGGPPASTHLGQGGGHFGQGNSTQNGTSVSDQSVAVGPEGPSLTDQVEPAQAPPGADQQTPGQPAQQPGSPGQQNGEAPGQQGVPSSQQPGAAGQKGGTSGQQSPQSPSQGGATPRQPEQGGTTGPGNEAASRSGSGVSAFLTPPDPGPARLQLADSLQLIDAALPSLSSQPEGTVDDTRSACGLSSLFGAAVVVTGGYQFALRTSDRLKGTWDVGPRDARRASGRRFGSPSPN